MSQSGELFGKVIGIFDRLGQPVPEVRRTRTELVLANGSRIVTLPGQSATVRSFSGVRLAVIDESRILPGRAAVRNFSDARPEWRPARPGIVGVRSPGILFRVVGEWRR